ncbi:HAD family hydrolase [candidate division KSB1 bacterium]|nr:HAD family hydrolase [candidate division KSB1 bacterium]
MTAVFFDRDDTLIKDVPYNGNPALVELMPNARAACQKLREHGFALFIISNQSGVGLGVITPAQVDAVNDRVLELLGQDLFAGIYCCYDRPDDVPNCRKPSPKMLIQASREHDIDLGASFIVGDRPSDVLAGKNAGCSAILYRPKEKIINAEDAAALADFVADDLRGAAEWIISSAQATAR